jgi:creatinine amidohydrolase
MQDLTWQEVAQYAERNRIALVPVGSTEQHGPAGVLGVDSYVAITLAEDVAQRSGVLCTPPIWFGDSAHHSGFPGTITVRTETLIAMVRDVCRSLARHGLDRIVLINGHKGSNLPGLTTAARGLHEEELPGAMFVIADPLHLARHAAGQIKETNEHHSGELELSQVLYRFPGKIREDRVTDAHVDFAEVFGGFVGDDLFGAAPEGVEVFGGFVGDDLFGAAPEGVEVIWSGEEQRAFTPTGSFSSSLGLSAEKGRAYHDHVVAKLCEVVDWMRGYDGPVGRRSATEP